MTDDLLDLRLRVARALEWVEASRDEHPSFLDATKTLTAIVYTRGDDTGVASLLDGEPTWGERWTLPDYPADVGACQEVLDAIEAREWTLELKGGAHTWQAAIFPPNDWANGGWSLGLATAPTFPEALCRAFVQAVEANDDAGKPTRDTGLA